MAKQIKSRRATRAKQNAFEVRQLWLAAIGAVSLSRKQGVKLYSSVVAEGRSLQDRVNDTVAIFGEQFNGVIGQARTRAQKLVSPLRARAKATLASVKSEVEARLQPVLARFGVRKSAAKRRSVAKPVARKTAIRKGAAKPAAKRAPAKRRAA